MLIFVRTGDLHDWFTLGALKCTYRSKATKQTVALDMITGSFILLITLQLFRVELWSVHITTLLVHIRHQKEASKDIMHENCIHEQTWING